VILAVVVLGITGVLISRSRNQAGAVAAAVVQKGTVSDELILTGTVKAEKDVTLYFPTYGKISWVGVSEGQSVKKGQALASLDTTILNASYQEALNSYRNYQAAAESALDSVKDHSSDETFAQKATRTAAEVARDNAYDAVRAAEYNLKNATLFAPFDGIVSSLPFANPGVNVLATDKQAEIVDPSTIYFEVDADQNEVTSIKKDQDVTIVLDSFQDKDFKGKVSFIGLTPLSSATGTTYKVKVVLSEGGLTDISPRIGMTGDAKFILSQKQDVLYAPPKFVHSDKDGKYVNLGKKGNKVRVEVGIESEERVEITSGVKEGDTLYD
jgi:RND family efflux transporter MFP subunit